MKVTEKKAAKSTVLGDFVPGGTLTPKQGGLLRIHTEEPTLRAPTLVDFSPAQ